MKKTLLISLILLVLVLGVFTMARGYSIGTISILSFGGLKEKDNALQSKIDQITSLATVDFENETNSINENKDKLTDAKNEYEDLVTVNPENGEVSRQLQQYEAEYLWTKIGNHAKKEGVTLKIDITKAFEPTVTKKSEQKTDENTQENTDQETEQSAEDIIDQATENVTEQADEEETEEDTTQEETKSEEDKKQADKKFDLKFAAIGSYVGIADFIYDIENDSTLGFKIEEFNMDSSEDTASTRLVATFTCKDIAIANITQTSTDQATEDEKGEPSPVAGSSVTPTNDENTNNTNSTRRNTTNSSN